MVSSGDGPTNALVGADRPVLVEGRSALNRGFVGTDIQIDIVCSSVTSDRALIGATAGGIVGTVGFDDIVFDKRASGPPVDGEVSVAIRVEGSGVVDDPRTQITVSELVQ